MPEIRRVVTVRRPLDVVWRFLADFTTTEDWHPQTLGTERLTGDGGLGTTYHTVTKFGGERTEIAYEVVGFDLHRCLRLRGTGLDFEVVETLLLTSEEPGSTTIDYHVELASRPPVDGPLPPTAAEIARAGDLVEESLRESLERLGGPA